MNTTTANEMVVFNPNEVGEVGNKFLLNLVAHEVAKEEAIDVINQAEQVESFIDVELTKAALFLHTEERIDLFKLYGNKNDSSVLYRSILTEMGVLNRKVTDDDKVEYEFTDANLRDTFYFDQAIASDKDHKDNAEHVKRRSRRNSLNIRLQKICKAAVAMFDAGASFNDIVYKDDPNTGKPVPMIMKGPKEVLGKNSEIAISKKGATLAEGATATPTIAGLAKLADAKHKAQPASKGETETSTRKPGEGGNANSEEDFLSTANVLMSLVRGREGQFSSSEKTVLKNLLTEIKEAGIK